MASIACSGIIHDRLNIAEKALPTSQSTEGGATIVASLVSSISLAFSASPIIQQ
jgi:hypothetical protein